VSEPATAVESSVDGSGATIVIRGSLDAEAASSVRASFATIAGRRIILDVDDVLFVDSAGLGAILGGVRRVRESGGTVLVRCRPGYLLQLLCDVGLDRLVAVAPTYGALT
jgi:anti-anti-sigma factor